MLKFATILLSLAVLTAFDGAYAKDWRCGSTATFSGGIVDLLVYPDDSGRLKHGKFDAWVGYSPVTVKYPFKLTIGYWVALDTNTLLPSSVYVDATVDWNAKDGRLELLIGDLKTSWVATPRGEFMFFAPAPPLSAAIVSGSHGSLLIVDKKGQIRNRKEFDILSAPQLLTIIGKAYPAAVASAAAPAKSSSCQVTNGSADSGKTTPH